MTIIVCMWGAFSVAWLVRGMCLWKAGCICSLALKRHKGKGWEEAREGSIGNLQRPLSPPHNAFLWVSDRSLAASPASRSGSSFPTSSGTKENPIRHILLHSSYNLSRTDKTRGLRYTLKESSAERMQWESLEIMKDERWNRLCKKKSIKRELKMTALR